MIGVGSKVVCAEPFRGVHVGTDIPTCSKRLPQKGAVYVVESIRTIQQYVALFLVGVPSFNSFGDQVGWEGSHFRELSEYRQAQELEYYKSLPVHSPL